MFRVPVGQYIDSYSNNGFSRTAHIDANCCSDQNGYTATYRHIYQDADAYSDADIYADANTNAASDYHRSQGVRPVGDEQVHDVYHYRLEARPTNIWEEILGTDSLLLLAEGQVVAGIDMTQITKQDIVIQGDHVSMTLPQPEILYSKIDNDKTHVYERAQACLSNQILNSKERRANLPNKQWSIGLWKVRFWQQAAANAQMQIEAFLRALGFTEIVIVVRGGVKTRKEAYCAQRLACLGHCCLLSSSW